MKIQQLDLIIACLTVAAVLLSANLVLMKREGYYALGSDTFIDVTLLDPTKFYYKGTRKTSATITPGQNGGTTCSEFPDVVYQIAPAINATCQPDIQNSFYTFDTTSVKGNVIYPRFFQAAAITGITNVLWFSFYGSNAVLCTPATSTQNVRYSTAFNSIAASFNNRDGTLFQCSLNSDGFLAGVGYNGVTPYGSYPFYNNGWSQIPGGLTQIEVGRLPGQQPLNAFWIGCNSAKGVFTAQYSTTNGAQTTSQPMTCVSCDENVVAGCDKDIGKAYYATVTTAGIINWTLINGSAGITYISLAKNMRAIAINTAGKLIACKDVTQAASMSDWKPIVTLDPTLVFKTVCYRGGAVAAAITTDNRLFIEMDLSFIFSI